jgi:hypothetical protein
MDSFAASSRGDDAGAMLYIPGWFPEMAENFY